MTRYSIFTEYRRRNVDFDNLRVRLSGLDLKVIDKQDNSVVVEYDGNVREFRKKVEGVLKDIKRNDSTHVYINPN